MNTSDNKIWLFVTLFLIILMAMSPDSKSIEKGSQKQMDSLQKEKLRLEIQIMKRNLANP